MSLAAAFAKSSGRKVKWNGQTVQSFHRIDVRDGDRLEIVRLSSSQVRAQSLKVAADRGNLRANGIMVPAISVWSHTAPDRVSIEISGRRVRNVDMWNSWSFEGVDSAWLGNAGMLIETTGDRVRLRCSDGLGSPTFEDLIVDITHHHG